MTTNEFFLKYEHWFTDTSNDSRGVFGGMDRRSAIPYEEFSEDVLSLPKDYPILVYYYHPSTPYFWIENSSYPPTIPYGPAPNNRPYIIKRHPSWYVIPESIRDLNGVLVFTILKWEFEVTLVFIKGIAVDFLSDRGMVIHEKENESKGMYTREQINESMRPSPQ